MPVVCVLVDEGIGARVGIEGMRADEMCAGELVPKVTVDGVDEEEFAMLVPIVSPGISRAGAECFHHFPGGMITPHRSAQRDPLLWRRPWYAHLPEAGGAAAPVQPAVRAKAQAIRECVVHLG